LVEFSAPLERVIQLCGLSPQQIMEIATKALEFWDYQKQTELEYNKLIFGNHQLRTQNMERVCNEKLLEAQSQATRLNHQVESMKEEIQNYKKELARLQDKYTEKSRQKRKLAELYDSIKQRHESKQTDDKRGSPLRLPSRGSPESRFPRSRTARSANDFHPITGKALEISKRSELDRFSLVRRRSPQRQSPTSIKLSLRPKESGVGGPNFSPPRRPTYTPQRPATPLFSRLRNSDGETRYKGVLAGISSV